MYAFVFDMAYGCPTQLLRYANHSTGSRRRGSFSLDVGVGVCFLMLTRRTITSHRASIEATTARPCEELANLRGPHSSYIICLGRFTFSTQPDSEHHASRSIKREPARSCTAGRPAHMSDRTRLTWTPHGRAFAHASAGQ
jgi:hypothetical protein